jgi:hypothetical protein
MKTLCLLLIFAIGIGSHAAFAIETYPQGVAATVTMGPAVDDTDGKTAETGLTISQADVRLMKNGAAEAQKNDTSSATHRVNGIYAVPLNATDMNTAGILTISIAESGALPLLKSIQVVPAAVYKADYDTSARGTVGRTWYVSTSGSSSNPGTQNAPLDTMANALSAASPGDTIRMLAGTYTVAWSITKDNITIIGDGSESTILNVASGNAVECDDYTKIIGCALNGNASGTSGVGVYAVSKRCVTLEDCEIFGSYDGIQFVGTENSTIRRCKVASNYDAMNFSFSVGLCVKDSTFTTAATYSETDEFRGAVATSADAWFDGCSFIAVKAVSGAAPIGAIHWSGPTNSVRLSNCNLVARATHASNTGLVTGVSESILNPDALHGSLTNCTILTSNAGSGGAYDLDPSYSASSRLMVAGTKMDAAKVLEHASATGLSVIYEGKLAVNQYDPPTRAEATTDKETIVTAVGSPLQSGDYTTPPTESVIVTAINADATQTTARTNAATAATQATSAATQTTASAIRTGVGLAAANLDTQLSALDTAIGEVEVGTPSPVLQHDIDPGFTFELPSRVSGITRAKRPIYLSNSAERPRVGFDVRKITDSKPSTVTAVEVFTEAGASSNGITVAEQDDTTNVGVRDYLVMSKVTGQATAGTYIVRLTFTAADTSVYVVEGLVVAP